jgi:hypothetical protein
MPADSRFDLSVWDTAAAAASKSAAEGSTRKKRKPEVPEQAASGGHSDDDEEAEDGDGFDEGSEGGTDVGTDAGDDPEASSGKKTVAPLSAKELAAFEARERARGLVYISRIPPGMTPAKVRHLLSGFGDVERVYLQDGSARGKEKSEWPADVQGQRHRLTLPRQARIGALHRGLGRVHEQKGGARHGRAAQCAADRRRDGRLRRRRRRQQEERRHAQERTALARRGVDDALPARLQVGPAERADR